jgi:hypothetical protein
MSASIDAVASDLIQDGIEEALEVPLEVPLVTAGVVAVILVVVVILGTAADRNALTGKKSLDVRLCAACTTDGAVSPGALGVFDSRKEISTDPESSVPSVSAKRVVCDLNDMRLTLSQ